MHVMGSLFAATAATDRAGWSDDSKQDAAMTTCNMRDELCVDGDPLDLVEGLIVGGTVWKGTDGAAVTYRCGK